MSERSSSPVADDSGLVGSVSDISIVSAPATASAKNKLLMKKRMAAAASESGGSRRQSTADVRPMIRKKLAERERQFQDLYDSLVSLVEEHDSLKRARSSWMVEEKSLTQTVDRLGEMVKKFNARMEQKKAIERKIVKDHIHIQIYESTPVPGGGKRYRATKLSKFGGKSGGAQQTAGSGNSRRASLVQTQPTQTNNNNRNNKIKGRGASNAKIR